MMWIDTHAHLYGFDDVAVRALLTEASENGVSAVINAATNITTCRTVIRQCSRHSSLYAVAGISPFDTNTLDAGWEDTLESLLDSPGIVGVGEIGLDNSNQRYPPLERQTPVFERQLDIARRLGLPAVIHSRGAERRAIDACRAAGTVKAVFHCFTGSISDLRRLLDNGYYVSFSGIITFAKNRLAELAAYAPPDRILIETDTPYLSPVPHRGKPNRPAWVALVGGKVAQIKGCPVEIFQRVLAGNVRDVFGISSS